MIYNYYLNKITIEEKTSILIYLEYLKNYYEEYFILLKEHQISKDRKEYKYFKKLLESYSKVIEDIEESL